MNLFSEFLHLQSFVHLVQVVKTLFVMTPALTHNKTSEQTIRWIKGSPKEIVSPR